MYPSTGRVPLSSLVSHSRRGRSFGFPRGSRTRVCERFHDHIVGVHFRTGSGVKGEERRVVLFYAKIHVKISVLPKER